MMPQLFAMTHAAAVCVDEASVPVRADRLQQSGVHLERGDQTVGWGWAAGYASPPLRTTAVISQLQFAVGDAMTS
jgi:hypothetical protein